MSEDLVIGILSVFLLVTAFFAITFKNLINSVLSLSIFSILLAVIFVMYQAPDVAMAEAVVGAGLLTSLFIVAISKTTGEDDASG